MKDLLGVTGLVSKCFLLPSGFLVDLRRVELVLGLRHLSSKADRVSFLASDSELSCVFVAVLVYFFLMMNIKKIEVLSFDRPFKTGWSFFRRSLHRLHDNFVIRNFFVFVKVKMNSVIAVVIFVKNKNSFLFFDRNPCT